MLPNTTDTVNTGIIHENTREVPTTTDEMIVTVSLLPLQIEVHPDHRTAHMHLHLHEIVVTTLLVTTVRVLTDRVILTQGQVPHHPQTTTNPSKKVQMVMSTVLICRAAVHMVHQRQVPTAPQDPHLMEVVLTAQVQLQALLLPRHTHQVHAID